MYRNNSAASIQERKLVLGTLIVIVCSYCAWVLSLPLFPTQDGPMHLYLVHVLSALLTRHGDFYQQFYYVRHHLPPYSLYYYTLMLFSSFLPVLVADKVIVCLYFVSFTFGFRYLAKLIGPSGELMALPATLLLLNWPLGMGFVNFCLSTSLAFWALGLWCRAIGHNDPLRKISFVLMAYIIMLTHPVPLLAVLGFCGVELGIRLIRFRRQSSHTSSGFLPDGWLRDALYTCAAAGTLVYVKLFTAPNVLKQSHVSSNGFWGVQAWYLKRYAILSTLLPFSGHTIIDLAYRLSFYGLLLFALFLAVRALVPAVKSGVWNLAQTWTFVCLGLLFGFPFIPADLNGSSYFAARVVLYVWVAALVAASGASISRRSTRVLILCLSMIGTVFNLALAHQRINPIAQDVATIERMPAIKPQSSVLFLHASSYTISPSLSYDPYFWSAARMCRRTDSVMYNTPWLELQIIPVGPLPTMPNERVSAAALNELNDPLRNELDASAEKRDFIFSHVDRAIVSAGASRISDVPDPLLRQDRVSSRDWRCAAQGEYSICSMDPQEASIAER